jgi:hypothetical protein
LSESVYETAVWLIVALHFAFIGFVVIGGLVALRWSRAMLLHVPAVVWGIGIAGNWVDCPLTWAERWVRARSGMVPLPPAGFIAHYLTGVLYPVGWLPGVQLATFAAVAASWALYMRRYLKRHVNGHLGRRRDDARIRRGVSTSSQDSGSTDDTAPESRSAARQPRRPSGGLPAVPASPPS